nr:MAG TPA: hypothetical protein [Caudoviricetes sp.]
MNKINKQQEWSRQFRVADYQERDVRLFCIEPAGSKIREDCRFYGFVHRGTFRSCMDYLRREQRQSGGIIEAGRNSAKLTVIGWQVV